MQGRRQAAPQWAEAAHSANIFITQPQLETANCSERQSQLSVIRPHSSDCAAYLPKVV